jgi:TonB-dependent starch-binding outer membrane protein SusC
MNRLLVLCAAAAFCIGSNPADALAQAGTGGIVRGTVVDSAAGRPLAGARVIIVGTQLGAAAREDGGYTITGVPAGQQTVRATMLGHAPQVRTVTVAAGQTVAANFQLIAQATQLSAMVSVGYGTQRRQDVTGAVASVKLEDVPVAVTPNVGQILQGRVAGAQVVQNNGAPGGGVSIQVRGTNSITATSEPLYVIDGVPALTGSGSNDAYQNPLASINPSDIESIDVLKDASATSIYGARGAAGVVLVTTKRGRRGENHVTVEASYGTQTPARELSMLNAPQFAQMVNEARVNGGLPEIYTPEDIGGMGRGTDWQDEVLRNAPQGSVNLSVTGGDDRTRYLISGNYFDQQGILLGSEFKRISSRVNLERTLGSRLQVGINLTANNATTDIQPSDNGLGTGSQGSTVIGALWFNPVSPVRNADGSYVINSPVTWPVQNPVALSELLLQRRSVFGTIGNVFGEYSLLENLRLRSTLGLTGTFERYRFFAPRTSPAGINTNGDANVTSGQTINLVNENTVNYRRDILGNSAEVVGGFTVQTSRFEGDSARNQQFANDLTGAYNLSSGTRPSVGSVYAKWALLSWLGRVNYNVAGRYIFTVAARADGSSRFGENSKWGYFPSASFAWRLIDEGFMKDQKLFSDLKVRLGYGVTGNQEIGLYNSLARLGTSNYAWGGSTVIGYNVAGAAANPDLKWETTRQFNGGLDLGWFDNRISASLDVYHSNTKDLLLSVQLPAQSGYNTQLQNIGSVRNNGVELSLNTSNIVGERFSWRTTLNFAANRNKVTDLGAASEIPSSDDKGIGGQVGGAVIVTRVGEPLGTFVGLRTDGVYQEGDPCSLTDKRPTLDCVPGEYRYVDTNGDGRINAQDRVILGNAQPDWYGGLTNDFRYGPFDLNVFLQTVQGNEVLNAPAINIRNVNTFSNQTTDALDRWTPTNTNTDVPRANANRPREVYDVHVEDGSFVRLQNVTLGYTLPQRWLPRVQNARVYVTGQNLHVWTDYKGYDPEVNSFGGDARARGIDLGAYPRARIWNVGLTATY